MQRWLLIASLCSAGTAELSEYSEFAKAFLASCRLRSQHLDLAVWEPYASVSSGGPSPLSAPCVEVCSAGSEAAILDLDFLPFSSVTVCTRPGQRPSRARQSVRVLLECLDTDPSHSEVEWLRSCLHGLRPRQAVAKKSGLFGKNLRTLQTNWEAVELQGLGRRLLREDPGPMLWLMLVSGIAVLGCLAWYCRKSSSCAWKVRARKVVAREGPPPDTHWRCAHGGLWWKGASSTSLEVEGLSDEEPREPSHGSEPLPKFQDAGWTEGRPATSPGRMRTRRSSSAPPRADWHWPEDRPSTAPASPGADSASERFDSASSRRQAWDARFAKLDPESDVPFRPRPPASQRGFAASFPGPCHGERPCTPADMAPHLEVDYGTLDRETNAQEFVQHLRHVRRVTASADRKKLFKELQLRWHPDKNVGDEVHASEMFKALQESKGWFLLEERVWTAPGVVHSETL